MPRCRHSAGNKYGVFTPYVPGGTRGEHNFALCKKNDLLRNHCMNTPAPSIKTDINLPCVNPVSLYNNGIKMVTLFPVHTS